ncbi:hypothetical protein [Petrotoga sp. 9PWA.NaAc.5.4]|uniref:hypothetical protein n=1 Tax=Petrotoga sp. 9PWA.NaAc.5.4 TaxID=1434328 RepID=UPI000CC46B52|nr:hypothetical protein [Petrotoga sp. 9PWA.NaAc.5.4]PNR94153.1 hypothetical protein X924_06955 [Petrotoga sp. 9PWA.NaAc.5.4]
MEKKNKKIMLLLFVVFMTNVFFSQTGIVDVPVSSPAYPYVQRMINTRIMSIDVQGRFRGSQGVVRYDLAEFGSNMLDYLGRTYDPKIEELEKRLNQLQNLNWEPRISNIENTIFAFDDRLSYLNSVLLQLEKEVSDILEVIQIGQPINEENIVFQNIAQGAIEVAEKTAQKEVQKISETSLTTLTIYQEQLDKFESEVKALNEKFDKVTQSLNNLFTDYIEKNQENFKNYIDFQINREIDALKTSLTNIARYEVALLNASISSTITSLDMRVANLESQINPQERDYLELNRRINENEAKLNYILENITISDAKVNNNDKFLWIQADIEGLKMKTDNILLELSSLSDQIKTNKSYIETFDARHFYYNNSINDMQKKYESLLEQINFQNKKLDSIIFEISKLSSNSTETLLSLNDTNLKNLEERVSSLERTMGIYYDEMGKLSVYASTFEKLNKDFEALKRTVEINSAGMSNLQKQMESIDAQVKALSKLNNLDQETLTHMGDIAELSFNFNVLGNNIENLRKEQFQLSNDIINLESRINEIENALGNFQITSAEIQELRKAYNDLLDEYYVFRSQWEYTTDTMVLKNDIKAELSQNLSLEIVGLERNINSLSNELYNLDLRLTNIEKTFVTYEDNIRKLTLNNEETLKRVEAVENSLIEIQKPQQNYWIPLTTGLLGVAAGVIITWFILSSQ